jgi:hypothetical protein
MKEHKSFSCIHNWTQLNKKSYIYLSERNKYNNTINETIIKMNIEKLIL